MKKRTGKKIEEKTSKIVIRFSQKKVWNDFLAYLLKNQVPFSFVGKQSLVVPSDWGKKILKNKRFGFGAKEIKRLPKTKEYQIPHNSIVYGGQYIL